MYLKKAQYEKPCLYEIPYDQSDPANRLVPGREETLTLEKESRSKLNKDLVRPYDYTNLNSLYEIFIPASQEYNEQLAHENELVNKSWEKHSHNHFCAPTALDMEVLIKTCLMPLTIKTQNDSFTFVHELKQEMHADLKYVESLENEINKLESDKAKFLDMYDILLQECVSNDVMCSYLHSLSDLDTHSELQCLYLHKVKEFECLAQNLSKQTESISNYNHQQTVYSSKASSQILFSVGQFCDADLEVAFRKSTCFVRDLQGNDLLTGNRGSDLYTISLQETTSSTPICLMAKALPTQAWLWHRRDFSS
ncbi:hypothetical protein Tco_0773137 [Tanacetum coccineum]|uniref:Integrase, catalytic region, zinc finger, CCHC-type, peptidase aspartic, catalytic n=1 Tax=Tanacetum coccineum TaxID=301880 RepID=A0ABQ4ZL64_9ASTR